MRVFLVNFGLRISIDEKSRDSYMIVKQKRSCSLWCNSNVENVLIRLAQ